MGEQERREAKLREEIAAAAAKPFELTNAALLDPKAYFAQWQQHQKSTQHEVQRLSRGFGKSRGKGASSGKGMADSAVVAGDCQATSSPYISGPYAKSAAPVPQQRPLQAGLSGLVHSKVRSTAPVSGLGLI